MNASLNTPTSARFYGLALALVMTLATLASVDTLATLDAAAPQMAQASSAPQS
jgi:predicted tellurium resistance membrane protein TerC